MDKVTIKLREEPPKIDLGTPISLKKCGNIAELTYLSRRNQHGTIKKLSKDEYILLSTGEVKQFQHGENRLDNAAAAKISLRKLRDYINTNLMPRQKWRDKLKDLQRERRKQIYSKPTIIYGKGKTV